MAISQHCLISRTAMGMRSPNFTPQTPGKISKNDPANCRPSPLPPPLPPNSKSLVFFADFCQPATALTLKARWRIWRILKWCPLQFLDIINHEESRWYDGVRMGYSYNIYIYTIYYVYINIILYILYIIYYILNIIYYILYIIYYIVYSIYYELYIIYYILYIIYIIYHISYIIYYILYTI